MTHPLAKRTYDFVLSSAGLVLCAPILLVIALAIKVADGGPVFYRQQRVGRGGKLFWIWKFRTMIVNADQVGLGITRNGDARVTPVGAFLRKAKLDELPQLWNVVRGEMSLVGPRPEVPRYVEKYLPSQRVVLDVRPGITDLASIEFRREEELLASATDVEQFYIEQCMPRKIELNLRYMREANLWRDTMVILRTLFPARSTAQAAGSSGTDEAIAGTRFRFSRESEDKSA